MVAATVVATASAVCLFYNFQNYFYCVLRAVARRLQTPCLHLRPNSFAFTQIHISGPRNPAHGNTHTKCEQWAQTVAFNYTHAMRFRAMHATGNSLCAVEKQLISLFQLRRRLTTFFIFSHPLTQCCCSFGIYLLLGQYENENMRHGHAQMCIVPTKRWRSKHNPKWTKRNEARIRRRLNRISESSLVSTTAYFTFTPRSHKQRADNHNNNGYVVSCFSLRFVSFFSLHFNSVTIIAFTFTIFQFLIRRCRLVSEFCIRNEYPTLARNEGVHNNNNNIMIATYYSLQR